MMVPLLEPCLCKVYQSFWNDIICRVCLLIEFKFCESDFYFLNWSKNCVVATYNFGSVYIKEHTIEISVYLPFVSKLAGQVKQYRPIPVFHMKYHA